MLAAVMRGADDLAVEEVPTPEPGPGEVLVAVGANTICGTDVRILRARRPRASSCPSSSATRRRATSSRSGPGVEGYETARRSRWPR